MYNSSLRWSFLVGDICVKEESGISTLCNRHLFRDMVFIYFFCVYLCVIDYSLSMKKKRTAGEEAVYSCHNVTTACLVMFYSLLIVV